MSSYAWQYANSPLISLFPWSDGVQHMKLQEIVLNIEPQEYLNKTVVSIFLASEFKKLQKPHQSKKQQAEQPTAQQVSAFASPSVQHPFSDSDQPVQQNTVDVDSAGELC